MTDYKAKLFNLAVEFFDDKTKARVWMRTPNPMYGWVTPMDMCETNGEKAYEIALASQSLSA